MADDPDIPFQKNPEALFPKVIEKLLQDGITRGILMKKKSIKIIIVTILRAVAQSLLGLHFLTQKFGHLAITGKTI